MYFARQQERSFLDQLLVNNTMRCIASEHLWDGCSMVDTRDYNLSKFQRYCEKAYGSQGVHKTCQTFLSSVTSKFYSPSNFLNLLTKSFVYMLKTPGWLSGWFLGFPLVQFFQIEEPVWTYPWFSNFVAVEIKSTNEQLKPPVPS